MQTKIILIAVFAVLSVALAGVLGYQKLTQPETTPIVVDQPVVNQPVVKQPVVNQPTTKCLKEGEISLASDYDPMSDTVLPSCCTGLKTIPASYSWRNPDGSVDNTCNGDRLGVPWDVVCTYCGNEICGKGENKCNCPEDCGNVLGAQIISANLSETNPDGQIIKVKFNHDVDPKTITKKAVDIGATCIPADSGDASLWGKNFTGNLSYDSNSKVMTIVPQSVLVGYTASCSWDLTLTGITGKDDQTFKNGATSFNLDQYIK